ncbi:hypothetical protein POSPLADRAFT_1053348 [Postia placenta MAD-698-R-SB12]|uniref:NAD(P)-binding protein n=1 Tax=Postia placenta MAD-698-R-SB12 TaxID=670580 RepID=A0A1X6NEC9_9APHY|nr:hypothetical protein POSPLADRAFT_1053348 [Postia placenta MAD-698-R-SB12]OSX66733.1 hypothetical protein POSPLADRAFT_1053348 [Postia placenta MAD-698-R-SB12]
MSPRVWLITGSSSGFGRHMTECALRHGDCVAATLRKPEVLSELSTQYPPDRLLVIKLDVTKPQEILDVFAAVGKHFGRIDVVFNNAGFGVLGGVEETSDELARSNFEVNFWGAVNVTREAVRFFREENKPAGGRLLQNSSALGHHGNPAVPFYCATKFALEGLTESLVMSLDPAWNIKITLVIPGWFRTDIMAGSMIRVPIHPAYAHLPVAAVHDQLDANPLMSGDTAKGVEVIYRVASMPDPPLRFPLGKDSVQNIRDHMEELRATLDQYESWSEQVAAE